MLFTFNRLIFIFDIEIPALWGVAYNIRRNLVRDNKSRNIIEVGTDRCDIDSKDKKIEQCNKMQSGLSDYLANKIRRIRCDSERIHFCAHVTSWWSLNWSWCPLLYYFHLQQTSQFCFELHSKSLRVDARLRKIFSLIFKFTHDWKPRICIESAHRCVRIHRKD